MEDDAPAPGLWERSRRAAYAEITDTALRLFAEQGFEATTIDQIAAAAGISRRSFFRYFGTKEDIVVGDLEGLGPALRDALAARPAAEGPWEALRAALATLPRQGAEERMLAVARLQLEVPSLRARHLEKHLRWQALLVPVLEVRMGRRAGAAPSPRAPAIVAAALACLDTATEVWARRGGQGDLADLYDEAVAAVRGA